jgi:hypothetical protein
MNVNRFLLLAVRRFLVAIVMVILGTTMSQAQETCILKTYASSWMQTGTPFQVQCASALHSGTLITVPARRFFKRGHLIFSFDEQLFAYGNTKKGEGKFQPGRGRQISSMLLSGGVGIGAKDLADGLSGAIFKSYYMIPITFATLAFFSNGGDVNLKPGFQIKVTSLPSPRGAQDLIVDQR